MNRLAGLKLKFDVTDNPELSAAIQRRVFELGGCWDDCCTSTQHLTVSYLFLGSYADGGITYETSNFNFEVGQNKLATLDDLYHLPNPKAKIVTPDGKEIELSDETWESLRESLK